MKQGVLRGKRILITGATGFIGSNLLRRCIKGGADVFIFIRKDSNTWRIKDVMANVKKFLVDLTYKETIEKSVNKIKPEIIFHTAVYGVASNQSDRERMTAVNLKGTLNLIDCCKKIDYGLFVNSGSSSEYGLKTQAMREEDILEPFSPYGVSKAMAGLYAQKIARDCNKPIVTLRLFSPYGYFEDHNRLIPAVILSCLKGENINLSSPHSVRDFIFIDDVVDAYLNVFECRDKISGVIFNIGSGIQYRIEDVVKKIIKLTGSKVKPQWGFLKNPRVEPSCWQANQDKAEKELCWVPAHTLGKGLAKTIKWFKKNINLYA